MKNKKAVLLFILFNVFCATACSTGYVASTKNSLKTASGEKIYSESIEMKTPQPKLTLGEKLTYQIRWLGLPAGIIIASVGPKLEQIAGQDTYIVKVTAKTNDFCSAIYKINDEFTSYIATNNMFTLRHIVHRREGRYKKDSVTDFDQIAHMAYFKNMLDNSQKTFKIPEKAQDTLSACYYFRVLELKMPDRIEYSVVNNEQNYELFGAIEDKKFIEISGLGNFESFFIQPYAKEIGGEQVKKGKVSGYFSADEKRLPLLAIVEAPLFTKVTATLSKIEYEK